jgi:hypothetical protein
MRRRALRKLLPHEKAHATGRCAEIIFRALSARIAKRWRFVSFRGAAHALKRGDLFELVLIQVKGGSAKIPV